jgi:hypothetical protein
MDNVPEIPTALEVRLQDLEFHGDNSFRIWLELEPSRYLALDFEPGTAASERLLEVLTELATKELSELGRRGVVISDFTPPAPRRDDEENSE